MEQLRIRQRWMPLPWSGIGGVLALVFGGIGVYCMIAYPDDEPSARVVIPLYTVALYWVIALHWNKRTAKITPQGVQVAVGPFPMHPAKKVRREDIAHCVVYTVRVFDDGTLLESYQGVSVETRDGGQITVSSPHLAADEAMQAANQVAQVLAPIEVRAVDYDPQQRKASGILMLAAFWLALAIAAIFAGAAWETAF